MSQAQTKIRVLPDNQNGKQSGQSSLQESLPISMFGRIKECFYRMANAKTFSVPSWAAAVILGVMLTVSGTIYWRLSDKLQESRDSNIRMEQALADLKDNINDKLKPVERQGLLNDEHQRSLDQEFADFKGYLRARNGEQYDQSKGRQ